jgi:tyrosyl-tRNA synthetase
MHRSKTGKRREKIVNDSIENAVAAVASKVMSMRQACAVFFCEIGTLHRHVHVHKLSQKVKFEYKVNNAVKQVFSTELEHLLEYIKNADRMHYGMSKMDVRKLAHQYARANKLKYPQQWDEN